MLADTEASKAVSCSATPASSTARDSVAGVRQQATCIWASSRFALWDLRSVALVALSMKSWMPRTQEPPHYFVGWVPVGPDHSVTNRGVGGPKCRQRRQELGVREQGFNVRSREWQGRMQGLQADRADTAGRQAARQGHRQTGKILAAARRQQREQWQT